MSERVESDRNFICDVEPRGGGGWEIWISEEPYRGIETDAALREWDRKRIGSAYTSRRLVGCRTTRFLADRAARRAVRTAQECAARYERGNAAWRENLARGSFRVTSADTQEPTP